MLVTRAIPRQVPSRVAPSPGKAENGVTTTESRIIIEWVTLRRTSARYYTLGSGIDRRSQFSKG